MKISLFVAMLTVLSIPFGISMGKALKRMNSGNASEEIPVNDNEIEELETPKVS